MNNETRNRFFSSSDQTWATPPELFRRFDEVFGFVLDPCAHPLTAKCKRFITKEVDGLTQDWSSFGNSFVNPPFGKELPKWIEKSYEESKKGIIVAMLIPARPDTKAWHKYCLPFAKILFIKGRITFLDQREDVEPHTNPAFFPSALVVFGNLEGKEIEKLSDLGVWLSSDDFSRVFDEQKASRNPESLRLEEEFLDCGIARVMNDVEKEKKKVR